MESPFHFWDVSQIEDVDQLLILIESWIRNRKSGVPQLEQYHVNPYRVMAITDRSLDILERICSSENLPSPIKKAACLCYFTAQERPLRHDNPDSSYAELEERIVNARMGFDFAAIYLLNSIFSSTSTTIEVNELPAFPSKHFAVEFVQRLAGGALPVAGLCMILELLLYMSNPHIAGIIDPDMRERLAKMVEGFDLNDLYNGLDGSVSNP